MVNVSHVVRCKSMFSSLIIIMGSNGNLKLLNLRHCAVVLIFLHLSFKWRIYCQSFWPHYKDKKYWQIWTVLTETQETHNFKMEMCHRKWVQLAHWSIKWLTCKMSRAPSSVHLPFSGLYTCVPLMMTVCAGKLTPQANVAVDTSTWNNKLFLYKQYSMLDH